MDKIIEFFKKLFSFFFKEDPSEIKEPVKPVESADNAIEFLRSYEGLNEKEDGEFIKNLWTAYGREYDEKTEWCGLTIAFTEFETGHLELADIPEKYEVAREWLNDYPSDKYTLVKDPRNLKKGDIVIRWRSGNGGGVNGWQGHVAYFMDWLQDSGLNKDGVYKKYLAFGGNQSDSISFRPCHTYMFLGALRRK